MRYLLFILLLVSLSGAADDGGWTKVDIKDNYVHIPITLNGVDATAVLDTGATRSHISKSFLEKHGADLTSGGLTRIANSWDDTRYRIFNDVPITMFDTDFKMDNLIESDLPSGDITVGMHFFRFYILQIDYPNSRIRMLDRKSVNMKKYNNIESRVEGDNGIPIVKIELDGDKNAWFVLDTSNPLGLKLDRSLSEDRGWLNEYRVSRIQVEDINRSDEMTKVVMPKVQFGPFAIEKVISAVPDKGHSLNLRPRYQKSFSRIKGKKLRGSIGYDVLKHFVVTIEYQTGFVHIGT